MPEVGLVAGCFSVAYCLHGLIKMAVHGDRSDYQSPVLIAGFLGLSLAYTIKAIGA